MRYIGKLLIYPVGNSLLVFSIFECFDLPAQVIRMMKYQHLLPVVANFSASYVIKLVIDNNGANDQYNGDAELKNHQAAPQPAAFKTGSYFAFQYQYGPE